MVNQLYETDINNSLFRTIKSGYTLLQIVVIEYSNPSIVDSINYYLVLSTMSVVCEGGDQWDRYRIQE